MIKDNLYYILDISYIGLIGKNKKGFIKGYQEIPTREKISNKKRWGNIK